MGSHVYPSSLWLYIHAIPTLLCDYNFHSKNINIERVPRSFFPEGLFSRPKQELLAFWKHCMFLTTSVFCKRNSQEIRAVQRLLLQISIGDFITFYVIVFYPCLIQLEVLSNKVDYSIWSFWSPLSLWGNQAKWSLQKGNANPQNRSPRFLTTLLTLYVCCSCYPKITAGLSSKLQA